MSNAYTYNAWATEKISRIKLEQVVNKLHEQIQKMQSVIERPTKIQINSLCQN